jgi:hypothetical protein
MVSCRERADNSSSSVSSSGVSRSAEAPPATTPKPLPPPASSSAPALSTTEVVAPALTDDAVRAFVTTWVAAQNAGKFQDYAAHYADRFTGTKR